MKSLLRSVSAATLITLTSVAAQAELVDVPGTIYNVDSVTGLFWLDVDSTQDLSYQELVGGVGNAWYARGWRLASGTQLNGLLASNLPTLRTAPSLDTDNLPFYGGEVSDFYAPLQDDPSGSVARLIKVLGGPTASSGPEQYGIVALFDRKVSCATDCAAHAFGGFVVHTDKRAEVIIGGGMLDEYGYPQYGHFLVSSRVSAVPEPASLSTLLVGLLSTLLFRWLRARPRGSEA